MLYHVETNEVFGGSTTGFVSSRLHCHRMWKAELRCTASTLASGEGTSVDKIRKHTVSFDMLARFEPEQTVYFCSGNGE